MSTTRELAVRVGRVAGTRGPVGEMAGNPHPRHGSGSAAGTGTGRGLRTHGRPVGPRKRSPSQFLDEEYNLNLALWTTSDLEDYVFLTEFTFSLQYLRDPSNTQTPDGYLFVCPPEDLRMGHHSLKWPDCPAFWSLDPSGAVRLGSEDAKALGFPLIHIETVFYGNSWDESVCEGLRRFYAGKGFNPNSQDLARGLGYPLLELSTEKVSPVACVEEYLWCNLEDVALCEAMGHYL
ncbi:hypothetical protein MSAN_02491700 [Mycena sanguinolenta]|uniref:Uncharacterized protein n=1 Tax=Mycena sanguinolenta TaxID=230812 RepID=A0A8H6U084_9AGAR|nr:hypothetical protein MSAN_02491700 [Mycena sanguinolenta]